MKSRMLVTIRRLMLSVLCRHRRCRKPSDFATQQKTNFTNCIRVSKVSHPEWRSHSYHSFQSTESIVPSPTAFGHLKRPSLIFGLRPTVNSFFPTYNNYVDTGTSGHFEHPECHLACREIGGG